MPNTDIIQSARTLFVSKSAKAVIVLDHVVMTRWSNDNPPHLYIYFTHAPHIILPESEGNDFLAAFLAYQQSFDNLLR